MEMSPLLRVCFHTLGSFHPTDLDTLLTPVSTDGSLVFKNSLKKHPIMSSVKTVSLANGPHRHGDVCL